MEMKICCTCKQNKPQNDFNKNKATKDGLEKRCKACRAIYNKNNSERLVLKSKIWAQKNREKYIKYLSEYYQQNQEQLSLKNGDYYRKHKTDILKKRKLYSRQR